MADEWSERKQVEIQLMRHAAEAYRLMLERMPVFDSEYLRLDQRLLHKAVGNAMRDLQRWADFHQGEPGGDAANRKRPDRHKYAGFLARWVAKEKPVQVLREIPEDRSSLKMAVAWVNSTLSVLVFAALLNRTLPKEVATHLRYWFAFRDERGETLAMVAYLSEQLGAPLAANGPAI